MRRRLGLGKGVEEKNVGFWRRGGREKGWIQERGWRRRSGWVQERGWKRRRLGFGEGVVENKVGFRRGVGGEEEVGFRRWGRLEEKKVRLMRGVGIVWISVGG